MVPTALLPQFLNFRHVAVPLVNLLGGDLVRLAFAEPRAELTEAGAKVDQDASAKWISPEWRMA